MKIKFYDRFEEFFRNTSIHGFRYIGDSKRTVLERFWWLTILCGCIYATKNLIFAAWTKWEENPILFSFKQVPMHPWDIPFPAVTICPRQIINRTKFDLRLAFSENYYTPNVSARFSDIYYLCQHWNKYLDNDNHYLDTSSLNFFIEVAPTIHDVFQECTWSLKSQYNCTNMFSPIFTEKGLCFTFNMLDKRDLFNDIYSPKGFMHQEKISQWSFENNYHQNSNISVYPRRVDSVVDFLKISLREANNMDPICSIFPFMTVYIHHPAELPLRSTPFIQIEHQDSYILKIRPEVTVSTNLESYSVGKRKCFYSHEGKLSFYKLYSEINCKMECLLNTTLNICGCAPYFSPGNGKYRLCGAATVPCESKVKEMIFLSSSRNSSHMRLCNCLPSCTSIAYNMIPMYRHRKNELGTIQISFLNEAFLAIERKELYGNVDFLASCGGILALFTGCSLFSLVEFISHFSVLWFCKLWKSQK